MVYYCELIDTFPNMYVLDSLIIVCSVIWKRFQVLMWTYRESIQSRSTTLMTERLIYSMILMSDKQ